MITQCRKNSSDRLHYFHYFGHFLNDHFITFKTSKILHFPYVPISHSYFQYQKLLHCVIAIVQSSECVQKVCAKTWHVIFRQKCCISFSLWSPLRIVIATEKLCRRCTIIYAYNNVLSRVYSYSNICILFTAITCDQCLDWKEQ